MLVAPRRTLIRHCRGHLGYIVWLALVFASSGSNAKTDSSSAALALPQTACAFTGSFTQTKILSGASQPLESTGQYFYHCQYGVIWVSQSPTQETLLLLNDGHSFVLQGEGLVRVSSRAGKFISRLVVGLMGGEASVLEQQFEIVESNQTSLLLVPKKRRLKRAIKSIQLITVAGTSEAGASASQAGVADIVITDRNDQRTQIEAQQTRQYQASDDVIVSCINSQVTSDELCHSLVNLKQTGQ